MWSYYDSQNFKGQDPRKKGKNCDITFCTFLQLEAFVNCKLHKSQKLSQQKVATKKLKIKEELWEDSVLLTEIGDQGLPMRKKSCQDAKVSVETMNV